MKMQAFLWVDIILQLPLKLYWCSRPVSVPFLLLWSRLNLLHKETLLGRDTTLLLVEMGSAVELKRDKPSSLQTLDGTCLSIWMLSLTLWNHKTKEFPWCNSKGTFAWIQFHLVSPKCIKGFLKIIQMLCLPWAFNQRVIHVHFNVLPIYGWNIWLTSLWLVAPTFFKPNDITL